MPVLIHRTCYHRHYPNQPEQTTKGYITPVECCCCHQLVYPRSQIESEAHYQLASWKDGEPIAPKEISDADARTPSFADKMQASFEKSVKAAVQDQLAEGVPAYGLVDGERVWMLPDGTIKKGTNERTSK